MPSVLETEEPRLADINGGGPHDFDPGDGGWGGDGDDGSRDRDPSYVPGAGLLAMRLAMVSISALFVTVGIAYYERSRSAVNWQHIHVPALLWLSTVIILASGWMLEGARGALERKDSARYLRWIEITIGFGLAFLASQVLALRELVGEGIYLRHNPHSSLFYVLTGAHGLHLLGGIAALCFLLISSAGPVRVTSVQYQRRRSRTGITALYWHFLTILWLGLFLGLLLWP